MTEFNQSPAIEHEYEHKYIRPPEGAYFIHGLPAWDKSRNIMSVVGMNEISCSLQQDGKTLPIRPFGFEIRILKGGILAAYDHDTTSKMLHGKKIFSTQSSSGHRYATNELADLIENTSRGKHNELWVNGQLIEIAKGYVTPLTDHTPFGLKRFIQACKDARLPVHEIPKPLLPQKIRT